MFLLSPAKLLVVLVVAVVVLGPDKLPGVARQIGGLWHSIQQFRERLESEVRGSFPDLPSADTISQAMRSPLTLLDSLTVEPAEPTAGEPDLRAVVSGPGLPPEPADVAGPGTGSDWLRSLQSLGVDGSELD